MIKLNVATREQYKDQPLQNDFGAYLITEERARFLVEEVIKPVMDQTVKSVQLDPRGFSVMPEYEVSKFIADHNDINTLEEFVSCLKLASSLRGSLIDTLLEIPNPLAVKFLEGFMENIFKADRIDRIVKGYNPEDIKQAEEDRREDQTNEIAEAILSLISSRAKPAEETKEQEAEVSAEATEEDIQKSEA